MNNKAFEEWFDLEFPFKGDRAHDAKDFMAIAYEAALATQADAPSDIETIAQQWDGCMYEAAGCDIDIGAAIRRATKRDSVECPHTAAPAQSEAKAVDLFRQKDGAHYTAQNETDASELEQEGFERATPAPVKPSESDAGVAWKSAPELPPEDTDDFYGTQYSVPVLLRDESKVLPAVARWSFVADGWVGSDFREGPNPSDYEWLNEGQRTWVLLSDYAPIAAEPVKPAESGAEYTLRAFGAGAHVVIYGDFDGAPAVVIYPAKQPGEVGASAKREGEFTDADLVGAVVLTFPTKEQTWRVSDALVNAPIGAGDALTDAEILNVAHGVGSVRMMPPAFLISFARALLAKRGGA